MMYRQEDSSCAALSCIDNSSLSSATSSINMSRSRTRKSIGTTSSSSSSSSSSTSSSSSSLSSLSSALTSTTTTTLLSVLACSLTILLMSCCLGTAEAGTLMGHPFSKRSFMDIQCKGVYDKSLFARLDRICEDCYNLFREPQLHTLCRKNCFTSDYFKGCLDVLLLQDEMEWIQTSIKTLHGADPGV